MIKKIILFLIISFVHFPHLFAQNFDINLLNKINSPTNETADKNWKLVTDAASPLSFAAPVTMFIVSIANHDKKLKINSYKTGASLLLSIGISTAAKIIIKRERPFNTYPELIYKKTSGGGYSFPSGHTTVAFSMATSLSLSFPKWYVIVPAFGYAAAVGYSRMYLGVHYPSDVLGGIISGAGISYLSFKAEKWLNRKK